MKLGVIIWLSAVCCMSGGNFLISCILQFFFSKISISKAFDKVWHAGLLCKLEALGVQPLLLQLFESWIEMLKFVKYRVDRSTSTCLYKTLTRPLIEYGDVIWNNCHNRDSALLDNVRYEATGVVTGAIKGTSSARFHNELAWEPLCTRREWHKLSQFYKIVKNILLHVI